jgi:hypothetical protein
MDNKRARQMAGAIIGNNAATMRHNRAIPGSELPANFLQVSRQLVAALAQSLNLRGQSTHAGPAGFHFG